MSSWTIRPITDDEIAAWRAVPHRNFHAAEPPADSDLDFLRRRYAAQYLTAAFDGGAIVGTFRTWDIDLPVPGGSVAGEAVSSVAVLPTHRRRGVLSHLMAHNLENARERGCALSILIASGGDIYGRFGYGVATEHCTWTVDTRSAVFREDYAGRGLEFELCTDADLRDVAPEVYRRAALGMPGAMPRDEFAWQLILGQSGVSWEDTSRVRYAVVARSRGVPVGYARYRVKESEEQRVDTSVMELHELAAVDDAAYAALWQFMASIDLVATIRAGDRPVHEPLPWLLRDRRAARQGSRADFQWVRLLDVPAALAARRYSAPGRWVVEVVDPEGLSSDRVLLESDGSGTAHVEPSTREPDVTLPLAALGSAYLGQVALSELRAAGLVQEHVAGAVTALDSMLTHRPTHAVGHTWF